MQTFVILWDWKESVDIADLNEAIAKVYDGTHAPSVTEVPDTGGDHYACIIASESMTAEQAQQVYDKYEDECC